MERIASWWKCERFCWWQLYFGVEEVLIISGDGVTIRPLESRSADAYGLSVDGSSGSIGLQTGQSAKDAGNITIAGETVTMLLAVA
ncbi:hypothetical protein GQ600_16712 [Phytophthora cactorum]|nr:hypothetical protein GQ600_16712 [Phytophthora cactorum]